MLVHERYGVVGWRCGWGLGWWWWWGGWVGGGHTKCASLHCGRRFNGEILVHESYGVVGWGWGGGSVGRTKVASLHCRRRFSGLGKILLLENYGEGRGELGGGGGVEGTHEERLFALPSTFQWGHTSSRCFLWVGVGGGGGGEWPHEDRLFGLSSTFQ